VHEELAFGKEAIDLSPSQALEWAETLLAGQGYFVVGRPLTNMMAMREGSEGPTGQRRAPEDGGRGRVPARRKGKHQGEGRPRGRSRAAMIMETVGREPAEKTNVGVDGSTVMLTVYPTVYDSLSM
jgi:hypothetical protein